MILAKCITMNNHDDYSEGYSSDLSIRSSFSQTPTSDGEPSLQEINDSRLIQALNYLNNEGGDDSPARYIQRMLRINHYLVQRLPRQGNDFDITLYQNLRATIREEFEAFNQAAQYAPMTVLDSVDFIPESVCHGSPEQFPEHRSTSLTRALYRRDEEPRRPVAKRPKPRQQTPGKAQHKPETKRAVPSGNTKIWPSSPTILSFPATGEAEYRNLPLCSSRSQLRLPALPKEVEDEIKWWCTDEEIAKVVEVLKRDNEELKSVKDYTLESYLDSVAPPDQDDATNIRHAVNASPIKLRASSVRSGAQSAREKALRAALDSSKGGQTGMRKLQPEVNTMSPVARRINRERAISLRRSPRRQSGVSTVPQSAEATPTEAEMPQQGPEIHCESKTLVAITSQPVNTSVTTTSRPVNTPANLAVSKSSTSRKVRRKRSIGEQAYTPERKRSKHASPQTQDKSGRFISEDSDDTTSDTSVAKAAERKKTATNPPPKPVASKSPRPRSNAIQTPATDEGKTSPSKPVATTRKSLFVKDATTKASTEPGGVASKSTVVGTNKERKAITAGKAARSSDLKKATGEHAIKNGSEQRVEERKKHTIGAVKTRSTRSGASCHE